jgi:hypothetical protein
MTIKHPSLVDTRGKKSSTFKVEFECHVELRKEHYWAMRERLCRGWRRRAASGERRVRGARGQVHHRHQLFVSRGRWKTSDKGRVAHEAAGNLAGFVHETSNDPPCRGEGFLSRREREGGWGGRKSRRGGGYS